MKTNKLFEEVRPLIDACIGSYSNSTGMLFKHINIASGTPISRETNIGDLGDYVQYFLAISHYTETDFGINWAERQLKWALERTTVKLFDSISVNNRPLIYNNIEGDYFWGIFSALLFSDNPNITEKSNDLLDRMEKKCIDSNGFVPYFTAFNTNLKLAVANALVAGQISESLLQLNEVKSSKAYARVANKLLAPWMEKKHWEYTLKGRIEYSFLTKKIYKLLGKKHSLIGKGSSFLISPMHKYYNDQSKELVDLWVNNVREASNKPGFRIIDLLSSLEILTDMLALGNSSTRELILKLLLQAEKRMKNGLLLSGKKEYAYHVDHQVDFYVILKKLDTLNFQLETNLENFRSHIFESFYRGQYIIERLTDSKEIIDNKLNTKYLGLFLKIPLVDFLLETRQYSPKDVFCQNILSDR